MTCIQTHACAYATLHAHLYVYIYIYSWNVVIYTYMYECTFSCINVDLYFLWMYDFFLFEQFVSPETGHWSTFGAAVLVSFPRPLPGSWFGGHKQHQWKGDKNVFALWDRVTNWFNWFKKGALQFDRGCESLWKFQPRWRLRPSYSAQPLCLTNLCTWTVFHHVSPTQSVWLVKWNHSQE